MITDPAFYVVAVPAVVIAGMSKGGLGGGLLFVCVPLMALIVSPVLAAGVLLPILIVMDLVGILSYRRTFDARTLGIMMVPSIIGIAAGWATAHWVSEPVIRLLLGLIGCSVVIANITRLGEVTPRSHNAVRGAIWGAAAGYTSFISHSGGVPFQVYVLPLNLRQNIYAGTATYFFAVGNLVKCIPYYFLGQLSTENLTTSMILFPLAIVSTYLGYRLVPYIKAVWYYRILYASMAAVSIAMLVSSGTEFLRGTG